MTLSLNLSIVPTKHIKEKFLKLPLPQKLIGIGAVIALLGAFLPWYQDIDAFNTGDRFLGITGPLYLVGYIIIALSIFLIIITGFYLLGKKLPPLPMKESVLYILSGALSLFLLIIANSVYFHERFGINITSKEYGIGMMFTLIGAIAITLGGVLQYREKGTSRFIERFQEEALGLGIEEEEEVDPVLELNNFQKEQQELEKAEAAKATIENEVVAEESVKTEPVMPPLSERLKSQSGVREYKAKPDTISETPARPVVPVASATPTVSTAPTVPTKVRMEPYPDPSLLRQDKAETTPARPTQSIEKEDKVNPNSVIRMDL